MNVPHITKEIFKKMLELKSIANKDKGIIDKRVEVAHFIYHDELTTKEKIGISMAILEDPCIILSALLDRAFYIGYSEGYQKCIDEFIKESNLDKKK